jgi:catechol 2,3-dioxygenase-like lactoylglutathione lyase family enzyme
VDQHVTFITLGVADLAASRRFYVDGLGWSPRFEVPGEITFFQVGHGLVLGIWGLEQLGADAGAPATTGTPFALASNVGSAAEVDAAVDRARAAGATVLKAPEWHPEIRIYHAYVADPDGHRWEIAYNPGLTVDADGTVHLG